MSANNYYDIDAFLAEEELIPCTTLFDFSHLSHLDPDLDEEEQHHLPENSRIKMPLWALDKWAPLGFVRMSLPRHFNRKSRERLEAEPAEVDIRQQNDHYFMSGLRLIELIQHSTTKVVKAIRQKSGRSAASIPAWEQVRREANELHRVLLATYTGKRLKLTMDWAMSSVGDDVSNYTRRLTEMERKLFAAGASSAVGLKKWMIHWKVGILPELSPAKKSGRVTPDPEETNEAPNAKRQRV